MLYSTGDDFDDCRYQVEINEDLCPNTEVDSREELLDLLFNLAIGNVQDVLLDYIVAKAIEEGRREGKKLIRGYRKDLTRKFNEAANE